MYTYELVCVVSYLTTSSRPSPAASHSAVTPLVVFASNSAPSYFTITSNTTYTAYVHDGIKISTAARMHKSIHTLCR
jgi:AmiR/NasT family two-component response regulator